jgi:uncharacterized UPF0160 family protein
MLNIFKRHLIVTHSGQFHPDDVFSAAVLEKVLGRIKVIRTRDQKIIDEGEFVIDVGGRYDPKLGRFDHHQEGGAGKRENGVPYASFGLVWKEFGGKVAGSQSVSDYVDKTLVSYVDAMDNGCGEIRPVMSDVVPYTLGDFITDMNPLGGSKSWEYDRAFLKAVSHASVCLTNIVEAGKRIVSAEKIVVDQYERAEDKRLIILDGHYPWQEILNRYKEPLYVVEPSSSGTWEVSCVRDNPNNFVNRKDLPKEWAGKRDKELQDITGVPDAIFCHNQLFVAFAKTKEGALKLAEKGLWGNNQ